MAHADLFGFTTYRPFLRVEFSGTGENRGRRANLAAYLGCQTSFVSQVLTDRTHFSLEHAIRIAEFLHLNAEEKKYFLLLVQMEKAGSKTLAAHFAEEISQIRKAREEIRSRINIRTELSADDQMRYYSTWYYSAVHILCALPGLNTLEAIATHLKLERTLIRTILEFLEDRGFVRKDGRTYQIGSTRIHLAHGSPMLPRHHANWRMRAIESVDQPRSEDLHYSGVLGIAKSDVKVFRDRLLQLLQEFEPIIRDSREDTPVVLLLDLFEF